MTSLCSSSSASYSWGIAPSFSSSTCIVSDSSLFSIPLFYTSFSAVWFSIRTSSSSTPTESTSLISSSSILVKSSRSSIWINSSISAVWLVFYSLLISSPLILHSYTKFDAIFSWSSCSAISCTRSSISSLIGSNIYM